MRRQPESGGGAIAPSTSANLAPGLQREIAQHKAEIADLKNQVIDRNELERQLKEMKARLEVYEGLEDDLGGAQPGAADGAYTGLTDDWAQDNNNEWAL